MTLALPLSRQQGLLLAYNAGVTTAVGADYDSLTVTYQLSWGEGQ
jgi:hypothetical protein